MSGLAWMADGACRGMDTDVFFPDRHQSTEIAKAACMGCSVRVECLEYALDNRIKHGVWGGHSERQRRRMRRQRQQAAEAA